MHKIINKITSYHKIIKIIRKLKLLDASNDYQVKNIFWLQKSKHATNCIKYPTKSWYS